MRSCASNPSPPLSSSHSSTCSIFFSRSLMECVLLVQCHGLDVVVVPVRLGIALARNLPIHHAHRGRYPAKRHPPRGNRGVHVPVQLLHRIGGDDSIFHGASLNFPWLVTRSPYRSRASATPPL